MNFETGIGGERISSYIFNKESFSLASYLENEAWHASTFLILSTIDDLKNLAENKPNTLCNILWEPLIKDLSINELNNGNLEQELNANGINRDSLDVSSFCISEFGEKIIRNRKKVIIVNETFFLRLIRLGLLRM